MDQRTPTVYRTRSWTNRNRALIGLGGLALLLLGYGIGRWQDTPSAPAAVPAALTASATAAASSAPVDTPAPSSPAPTPVEYGLLQAESASELAGIQAQDTQDESGGQNVGWINRGDHLRFDKYDFGEVPATKAKIRVASAAGVSGRVQIRLDGLGNAPVGELSVSNTGGWQTWRTDVAALRPVTGTHTIYLTFTAPDDSEFMNVNWIQFEH
ncbi:MULTISPECIES: carbohydrate-binding protein [unclassified Actinoplanes]|uniref:carbohydrate-binding protein n=1 Tax=unclassified Actinoplanes TaxID=2626549 RepID=UPI0002F2B165|nr:MULTISPECIES: carbohydrate-binding protein [unclassified Actinoplanes]SLM03587.1 arabinoxylan arabinofuranohydrolase [Actinoplanes sp. SE50/110]